MPQDGQVVEINCSPTWKKIEKSFKTLPELKFKFISKALTYKTPRP